VSSFFSVFSVFHLFSGKAFNTEGTEKNEHTENSGKDWNFIREKITRLIGTGSAPMRP
jgi:hypothetical protein